MRQRRPVVPPSGAAVLGERGRRRSAATAARAVSRHMPGCARVVLEAGEAITIITPTGGGFGPPSDRR